MKTADSFDNSLAHGSIAHSKFEPYSPGVELVQRKHLLALLDAAATRKMGLVVAPAGFGKSIIISQWVARQSPADHCCAWLTLDAAETDGVQFLCHLILALGRAGVVVDELEGVALAGLADAPIASVLSKLIDCLQQHGTKIVLVLEDYHHAESESVNDIVRYLLRETDSRFVLFLDSRERPDLDTSSRIAAGEALHIGPDQLRMSEQEVAQVLADLTSAAEAKLIHGQTEGWPVAIQLMAASKRTQPGLSVQEGLTGDLIASYLTEQIISQMAPSTRSFLLKLALLERFNYDLADHVHQASSSRSLLVELDPVKALLIRSSGPDQWVRLHHLFAEYLRDLAIREDAAEVDRVFIRASQWFEERGLLVEAVKYASKAKSFEICQRIILDAGGWRVILTQGIGVLRSALSYLSDSDLLKYPRLGFARAYLHCKDGEIHEARALLNAAICEQQILTRALSADDLWAMEVDRLIVESMIRLYEDHSIPSVEYKELLQKYRDQEGLQALDMGTLLCDLFIDSFSCGGLDADTEEYLRQAFANMRESGSVLGLNYCYLHAAHLALLRGEFDLGAANVERALQMAEENFGSDSGLKYLAVLLKNTLLVWQGDAVAADAQELHAALRHTMAYDGWAEIYLVGYGAVIMLARQTGDFAAAREITSELLVFSKQRALDRLTTFVEQHVPELDSQAGTKARALPAVAMTQDRFWQSRAASVRLAAVAQPTIAGFEETFATTVGTQPSPIYKLYLMTSYAVGCERQGETAVALELLNRAIELAVPQRILGPFLTDDTLLRLLRALRDRNRGDERRLIALQFLEVVLERANLLRPVQAPAIFSAREMDVLDKLLMGFSNKEIARALELTENTVKFHLKKIYTKLGVRRRTQAITRAQELGVRSSTGISR